MTQLLISPQEYETLLKALKERIRSAQLQALRSVNSELISLYADIGRMIVEKQQGDTWGKSVVGNLAEDLRKEFPATWSHNITILEKCKSEQEREFYIRSCRKFGWSRNVLVHQIENQAFQRTMTSQTNFGAALEPATSVHAQLAVKDEYTFAFLDLEDAHSERELERALTERVGAFLQEMGNMFAFVGSQYKIQVGERDFFIDLLLYHRKLRALVALELKIGEFEPEYIGYGKPDVMKSAA